LRPILADLWRKLLGALSNDGQVNIAVCCHDSSLHFADYAQDHAELGAALNGFSLNETGQLSAAIEKTGQAVDATYISTTKLVSIGLQNVKLSHFESPLQVQELEQNWAEPIHEYSQFSSIIKKLLAYRHQKQVQYEMTEENLAAKKEQLEELEKSEREARRLEDALGRSAINNRSSVSPKPESENNEESVAEPDGEQIERPSSSSSYVPPHPGPSPVRRTRAPGMGFLNALSYTLHGMMDVDPETARRNGISKTRETISQVIFLIFFKLHIHLSSSPFSWKTHYTWLLKTSSIQTQRYNLTWTGSSGKKWLTSGKW